MMPVLYDRSTNIILTIEANGTLDLLAQITADHVNEHTEELTEKLFANNCSMEHSGVIDFYIEKFQALEIDVISKKTVKVAKVLDDWYKEKQWS